MIECSAFIIRISAFSLSLKLLPRRINSPFLSLLLFGAIAMLVSPYILFHTKHGSVSLNALPLFDLLKSLEDNYAFKSNFLPTSQSLLVELGVGFYFGLLLSAGAYAAELIGQWLEGLLLGPSDNEFCSAKRRTTPFANIFVLVFAVLLFVTFRFPQLIATVCAAFWLPIGASNASSAVSAVSVTHGELTALIGKISLSMALLALIPVIMSSLLMDFSFIVLNRYWAAIGRLNLVRTAKLPILLLVLSAIFLLICQQLIGFADWTISQREIPADLAKHAQEIVHGQ